MIYSALTRRAVLQAFQILLLAGCGGESESPSIPADELGMRELAAAYRDFFRKNKRGPKNIKELEGKGRGFPNAAASIRSGDLVVLWGTPLTTGEVEASPILAHMKDTSEGAVRVLMGDGKTLRTMNSDEFRSASKVVGP